MGAQVSIDSGRGAGAGAAGHLANDADAFRRAWREGVPFTLLHDEAFVAEKYQEISAMKSLTGEKDGDPSEAQLISGTNGVPMDELQQVADLARVKLFSKRRKPHTSSGKATPSSSSSTGDELSSTVALNNAVESDREVSSVLTADLTDKILSRESAESVASERLRKQRTEIVEHYFAILAERIQTNEPRIGELGLPDPEPDRARASTALSLPSSSSSGASYLSSWSGSPAGVFSVGSFRVQLEMLREFRKSMPRLFENSVLTIVQTLLDFPPFALQSGALTSSEQAMITDTHEFCRSILDAQEEDLPESQRQVTLLLLLAFGVSSGRISLLLDFTEALLLESTANATPSKQSLRSHSFEAWVEVLLNRLESYRIDVALGTLEKDTLVNQFPIKLVSLEEDSAESDKLPGAESITTDGNFMYTWSLKTGLLKVGTGLNFTIAGRVYVESSPQQYTQSFQRQRVFRAALYGSGRNVTDVVQNELSKFKTEASSSPGKNIRDTLATGDLDDLISTFIPRRLFVMFSIGGVEKMCTLGDSDEFKLLDSQMNGAKEEDPSARDGSIRLLAAFYGDFEVLQEEGMDRLRQKFKVASTSTQDNEELSLTLSLQLLGDLLAGATISMDTSESTELILFFSTEGEDEVSVHTFRTGEQISEVEDKGSDAYLSSLVFCGDSLYMSILCSGSDTISVGNPKPQPSRKPRRLVRISPQDLSVIGIYTLQGDESSAKSMSSKPFVAYVSEGMRIYEVEMSADRFNVQVFSPDVGFNGALYFEFVRSFAINTEHIKCPQFVSYFLSFVSVELNVPDAEFTFPAMYTNGKWLGIVVSPSNQLSDKSHCVMFDCEEGVFIGETSSSSKNSSIKLPKCHERVAPGRLVCFDAKNNLVWTLDYSKASFSYYRNPGKRISLSQRTSPAQILDQARQTDAVGDQGRVDSKATESGVRFEVSAGTRVLGFLSENAEVSEPSEWSVLLSSNDTTSGPMVIPFVTDLGETSFTVLLKLIKQYAAPFQVNAASITDSYCLQACVSILNANVVLLLRTKHDKKGNEVVKVLREELSPLLNGLIYSSSGEQDGQPEQSKSNPEPSSTSLTHDEQNERTMLGVISKALDLYATCIHIFHPNVVKQFEGVLKFLKPWKNGSVSVTELKIVGRLLGHLSNRVKDLQLAILESAETFETFKKLIGYAVAIQKQKLENILRSSTDKTSLDDGDALMELTLLINSVSQSLFVSLGEASSEKVAMEKSLLVFSLYGTLCDGCEDICAAVAMGVPKITHPKVWVCVEKTLKRGFFGVLSPMLFSSGLTFLRNREHFATRVATKDGSSHVKAALFDFLKENAQQMSSLLKVMETLGAMIDPEAKQKTVESVVAESKLETMESAHEYENNLDELKELRIPGATRLIVTFDSRSRTENNYDYVTFYKDQLKRERYGEGHFSGRDSEYNWPGVGSNPPLIIESDHCFVEFHTDRSNTDWGYKFTARAEILKKKTSVKRHWLVFLTETIVHVLDETMKIFVDGSVFSPISEAEVLNERFLHSDLVKGGICADQNQNTNVLQLLKEFAYPPANSHAEKVVNALMVRNGTLRQRSTSSSLSNTTESSVNQRINSAVRAVAAAILHHNMWGMDAYAFAEDLRNDISDQLLRGWKNAQKMRDWFHLGDAADAGMQRQGSRKLRRQPSAFKGISEESLQILCENVIGRAQFLLELTPASFSYVSSAKRRWGLLAKYGHAIGKMGPSESAIDKWYNLLDELQAATELRSLFQYRRNSSERMRGGQTKSVTEQILEFIQSDVDIDELLRVIETRNVRARSRAFGIELFVGTWVRSPNIQLKAALVESFASTMKKMAQTYTSSSATPNPMSAMVHFSTKLSGCQESLRHQVSESFGKCLSEFSSMLNTTPLDNSSCALIVAILKACALDYHVEDSYLLHESRILTQVLRLMSSDVVQIRRAAQSVLGVFLARFVVGKTGSNSDFADERDNEDLLDATAFQRQLFSAVGLQLEGIVAMPNASALTSVSDHHSDGVAGAQELLSSAYHYLPDGAPGLTAPCLENNRVSWNHSIMLWVYVHGENNLYALKVGDEVRHGPDWKECNDEGGGDQETGVVSAVVDPTKIEVRWSNSVGEYIFDPKVGIYEVLLIDQGVGGVIFYKGNKTMIKETAFAAPWSNFGLFLNDQRQLSYKISCGGDRECVYNSNYELDANEWSHVAVVQEGDTMKFFVNGVMASHHLLDPFLLMHGNVNASESKIIESKHPYPDSVDQYWPVHILGASKIRVTFDPLCDIDQSTGFVRFYKNARCNEFWGEEQYSGKYHDPERNFPGAQSQRARGRRNSGVGLSASAPNSVEIPSDRFLVYFHNEGSSNGWGFRLLAVPQYPSDVNVDSQDSTQVPGLSLNPFPFYFGEPPCRVLDEPAAKCTIYQPKVCDFATSESDIVSEIQTTCPGAEISPATSPSERALHILSSLQTCCETPFGRSLIGSPENIGNLLFVALDGRVATVQRCASIAILRELMEYLSPEIAEAQLKRVFPRMEMNLVEHLFGEIGEYLNVWKMYFDDEAVQNKMSVSPSDVEGAGILELRRSAQETMSLVSEYISLLRSLAGYFNWNELIVRFISASVAGLKSTTKPATHDIRSLGKVIASCALLGGSYGGITIGGRVTCCVNIDGKETVETGYLLQFRLKNGVRTAQILFDCDKSRPIDVPMSDIAHLADEELEELEHFHTCLTPFAGDIRDFFKTVLEVNVVDTSNGHAKYKPKITRKENVEVLESEHPYCSAEDVTYPLDFRGADEIVIYFDETSCTAGPNDYITFLKRNEFEGSNKASDKEHWGDEKYFGDKFPGVGDVPPLHILAASVDVYFHTDSSTSRDPIEWGFKLTAHAFEDTLSYPPEIPPSVTVNALNDIRARCLKAVSSFFRLQKNSDVVPVFASLVSSLVKIANEPSEGRPTCSTPRTQVFESKHPYSDNVLEYMEVAFSGASTLTVTFDSQCRTEKDCDYLSFFKDRTLTDRWGAYQYTGEGVAGNWPGVGGRPPLVIPSDSFTLFWCTDQSNADWGWKFTVTAEFKPMAPSLLSLERLDKRSYHLFEILYEKMKPQRSPYPEEFEGYEAVEDDEAGAPYRWKNDPIHQIIVSGDKTDASSLLIPKRSTTVTNQQTYTVIDEAGAKIYKDQSKEEIIGELVAGQEFAAICHGDGWLRLVSEKSTAVDAQVGWVWQRSNDKLHVTPTDSLTRHENLLVLGIDDSRVEVHHSVLEMNESNQEQDALSNFFTQFAFENLKAQCNRFQSFAYDSHRALATKCAREAILGFISCRASVGEVQLSDFEDENQFLVLLSHLFPRDQAAMKSDSGTLEVLESTMRHLIDDPRNTVLLERTMNRCLHLLGCAVELLPPERGALRVLESAHPYESKTDQYWRVSIPGAKRIVITCDSKSKSESGCAWLCFYKDGSSRTETYGESQYGGRGDSANWPGCGRRPPLIVRADSFEAHFRSESDKNDWGFKMFAVGVFDNGSDVADQGSHTLDAKSVMLLLNVCCWLLEIFTAELSKNDRALSKAVYSSQMMEALIFSLSELPLQLKPSVLQILIDMTQNPALFHSLPHPLVERVRDLVKLKLGVRYKAEEASESKSHYLQTLVQCAVAIDLATESGRFREAVTLPLQSLRKRQQLTLSEETSSSESFEWTAAENQTPKQHYQFQLLLTKVTSPFSAVLRAKSRSAQEAQVFIEWNEKGGVCFFDAKKNDWVESKGLASPLCAADTVSFQLDFERHLLVLRKNNLVAGVIGNGPQLGSVVDWTAASLSSFEEQVLTVGAITGDANDELFGWIVPASPLALVPTCIAPSWYTKLIDSVGMMLAFHDYRSAEVVVEESAHPLKHVAIAKKIWEVVKIPGAVALEIKFDKRSKLGKKDSLQFCKCNPSTSDPDEEASVCFTGLNGDQDHLKNPLLFLSESQKRSDLVRVGDLVVRSRDWEYADEDGGIGSIGTAQEVVSWNGQTGAGVRVLWRATGKQHVYRCGFNGRFDVQLHLRAEYRDPPLLILGDTLSYSFQPSVDSGSSSLAFTSEEICRFSGSLRLWDAALNLQLNDTNSEGAIDADCTFEMWMQVDKSWELSAIGSATTTQMELFRLKSPDPQASLCVSTNQFGSISAVLHTSDENQTPVSPQPFENDLIASSPLAFDQWVHFAVVLAGSKLSLYQNGELCYTTRWDRSKFSFKSVIVCGKSESSGGAATPFCGHLYDVRLWNVVLKAEQLKSHAKGLDTVSSTEMQPKSPALPKTPRTHGHPVSSFLIPPSPPRSPSRSITVPNHLKKWTTTNRTGKDMVSVRLNASVKVSASPSDDVVYYEAYPLSSGKISIGWMWSHAVPSSSEFVVGESDDSFSIEPHQRVAYFRGNSVELEPFTSMGSSGLTSPRVNGHGNGSFNSPDLFCRTGDVIGCAIALKTSEVLFYINGQLVARAGLRDSEVSHSSDSAESTSDGVNGAAAADGDSLQDEFDQLVDEMCSIGFSRQSSTEAVSSSGAASTAEAVDWLLERDPNEASTELAYSPRRRSARSRSSSQSAIELHEIGMQSRLSPVVTLGPQGAQGVVWNFGERAFKYKPAAAEGSLVSVFEAAGMPEEKMRFKIYDHSEASWQQVAYRHKVQEITPQLLGWWKLDEGEGAMLNDSSGNNNLGEVLYDQHLEGETPSSVGALWDQGFSPPSAALRRNSDDPPSPFSQDVLVADGEKAKHEDISSGDRESVWGYRFYVTPHYSLETIGHERFQEQITRVGGGGVIRATQLRQDKQLVKYVNKAAQAKQMSVSQLLRATWSEIAPQHDELLRWPVLLEIATGVAVERRNAEDGAMPSTAASVEGVSQERLAKRFKVLQDFNAAINRVLPFVGFRPPPSLESSTNSTPVQLLYNLMSEQRHRIFNLVKRVVWDEALGRTSETSVALELTLNRPKATRHRSTGKVDTDGRYALFSQAFRQLNSLSGAHYRRADRFYHVTFLGENAQDAGGPYRETMAQYCEELHSAQLPLLLPTSNSQHNVGAGREKWVLNPRATTVTPLQMYEFLGKLMGVVLRSKQYLSLNIALMIWKRLVGEQLHVDDLAAVDSMIVNSMHKMRTIDTYGVTEEMFEDIVLETFTTLSSDNRVVPLKPGGQSIAVTFANRCEYADLVEKYRLHEFDLQIAALYRGISTVVPAKLLSCFTGPELELMVCGSPEVDVDLLEKCTEYSSCSTSDAHIVWFWQVLRSFSHDERSAFLRFVWGRSRLPAHEKEFPQLFKLQSFSKAQPGRSSDAYLPISHTCFFSVEMPVYSSEQVLRDKLLYAIYNCQEIDGDGDSVAANQLGWEE